MKLFRYYSFPAILVVATILRFINFTNRWGLGYDQALFAVTGKYALDAWQIPLLGPFSSGGPFQTSGTWFWLITIGNILFPGLVEGPWVFMGILSVATTAAMILTGTLVGGKTLGFIAGMLTAVSTAQITQSTNLSNQTPIGLPAALSLLAAVAYGKTGKPFFLFFLGMAVGIASSIHLQGLGLFPLVIISLLIRKKVTLQNLSYVFCGLVLPWLPVLLADAAHDWYNTKNMITYYTVDQYKISLDVLGRRWLTFAGQFIPSIWGFVIGGYKPAGVIMLLFTGLTVPYLIAKRKLNTSWLLILLNLAGMFTIVRYTRVPLYDSFVVFLHPSLLLVSAGIIWILYRINKIAGIFFLLCLVMPAMTKNIEEITRATNLTAGEAVRFRTILIEKFPGNAFALYDWRYQTAAKTLPLLLYLDQADMLSPNGRKVGISQPSTELTQYPVIYTDTTGAVLFDLESSSGAELLINHWARLDFKTVYDSVEHWWKKE